MRNLNRVQLFGNLTRDPELTYTKNNTALCKVGIAVNRSWKDANGEWQEQVTFVDLTAWGKMGERFSQMKKGEKVFVEGRLQTDSWTDDKGNKRSRLTVIAEEFEPWGIKKSQPQDTTPDELPPDDDGVTGDVAGDTDAMKANPAEEVNPDDIPF